MSEKTEFWIKRYPYIDINKYPENRDESTWTEEERAQVEHFANPKEYHLFIGPMESNMFRGEIITTPEDKGRSLEELIGRLIIRYVGVDFPGFVIFDGDTGELKYESAPYQRPRNDCIYLGSAAVESALAAAVASGNENIYKPVMIGGRNYIALDVLARFLTQLSGEHAPCVFDGVREDWGSGDDKCDGECYQVHEPECWAQYVLHWLEKQEENE